MAMANLPNPTKVSGKYNDIYEAYYRQIDPKCVGTIEAMVAASFLKKSGLSDVVLSRIWDLSDPTGRGYLDKEGFFVALKLVGLAQAGDTINMANIFMDTPNPPKVGEIPKILPPKIQSVPPTYTDWSIKPADRLKYELLFDSLQPNDGLLPGDKVRGVLMDSKLPLDALSKIWDLADQDRDGSLDKHEFLVAMHLVYQALDKKAIPTVLPNELTRPKANSFGGSGSSGAVDGGGFVANFPKDIAPPPVPPLPAAALHHHQHHQQPPAIPPMPRIPQQPSLISDLLIQTSPISSASPSLLGGGPSASMIPPPVRPITPQIMDWVVTPADKLRFDAIFTRSDLDNDGLVSGGEIKDVFLESGIQNVYLAKIWALCDTNQSGKLTSEQFALAMWMVERKRNGIDPPSNLTPNMIPPSFRQPTGATVANSAGGGMIDIMGAGINDSSLMQEPAQPQYSNPELAMISKEIEDLAKERRFLENDVTQKEADIRIKTGEVRSLQSELDTLAATLKQLENQKGEAQKRLDDLKAQSTSIDESMVDMIHEINITKVEVNKIRDQCQKQEDTIREQEGELDSKRGELQKLKDEESALEKEYDTNRQELETLSRNLQDTQLQMSQIKTMVTQLQESQRQMSESLATCKLAITANDPTMVSDYSLILEPDFRDAKSSLLDKNEQKSDPFNDKSNGFGNSVGHSNGFNSDPFGGAANNKPTSGFDVTFNDSNNGFDDSFNAGSGFRSDAFSAPAGSGGAAAAADPFGDKRGAQSITPDPGKDDFGSDPFAILHAPTSASQILSPSPSQQPKSGGIGGGGGGPPPRPESPSPALPPKKAKQPPPRPAPPRPAMGPTPTRPEQPSHGFGSGGGSGGFADFDDFDAKINNSNISTMGFGSSGGSGVGGVDATSNINTTIGTSGAVVDFAEDPFKDYRYEDPFSIKDPFADDDTEATNDPFASINITGIGGGVGQQQQLNQRQSPYNTSNASSVSADFSKSTSSYSATNNSNNKSSNNNNNNNNSNSNQFKLPPIDKNAFLSIGNKANTNATNITASTTTTIPNNNFAIFDNDGNDDNFGIIPSNNETINTNTTISTTTTNDSDFFDAFNDNFNKNKNSTNFMNDPFGGGGGGAGGIGSLHSTTTTTINTNNANNFATDFNSVFVNNFEDEFAKVKLSSNNNNNFTSTGTKSKTSSPSFAKFESNASGGGIGGGVGGGIGIGGIVGFGGGGGGVGSGFDDSFGSKYFNDTKNNSSSSSNKMKNTNSNSNSLKKDFLKNDATKPNDRFASDYSKGDTFDKDLDEILKRSLVDQ